MAIPDTDPDGVPPTDGDPTVGRVLDGRYRIVSKLGEGGMGLVFEATHVFLKSRVAVKILRSEASDDEALERLKREAQAASAIGNPHIVDVRDFGRLPDGSTYVVMEFIDGIDLFSAIRRQRLEPERARKITVQIADALADAHAQGIIHRDLKPENILLTSKDGLADYVKIVDFGIARVQGASRLTAAGRVVGTPEYMAPEQCAGIEIDHRADIYALGILLYEMLTGELPFYDSDLVGMLRKQIKAVPTPPSTIVPDAQIPLELEAVVLRCLAKRPGQRFQSMREVADALETYRVPESDEPPEGADPFAQLGDMRLTPTTVLPHPTPAGGSVRSSRRLAVGLAAFGIATGTLAAVIVLTGRDEGATSRGANQPSAVTAPPEVSEADAPARAPDDPEPAPTMLDQITITTNPPGARVYRDGALIGETPAELIRPAAGTRIVMTLRHRGYSDEEITIGPHTAEALTVTLAPRRPRTVAPTKRAPPRPPTQPSSSDSLNGFLDPWQ